MSEAADREVAALKLRADNTKKHHKKFLAGLAKLTHRHAKKYNAEPGLMRVYLLEDLACYLRYEGLDRDFLVARIDGAIEAVASGRPLRCWTATGSRPTSGEDVQ